LSVYKFFGKFYLKKELRTWSDDILTDAIIKYNQEVPKDKKKIATTIAIRERLRQQNLLKLEPSNEFK